MPKDYMLGFRITIQTKINGWEKTEEKHVWTPGNDGLDLAKYYREDWKKAEKEIIARINSSYKKSANDITIDISPLYSSRYNLDSDSRRYYVLFGESKGLNYDPNTKSYNVVCKYETQEDFITDIINNVKCCFNTLEEELQERIDRAKEDLFDKRIQELREEQAI